MTDIEKQQLLEAVIAEIRSNTDDVSSSEVAGSMGEGDYVLVYKNGGIAKINPDKVVDLDGVKVDIRRNGNSISENARKIQDEVTRATEQENALHERVNLGIDPNELNFAADADNVRLRFASFGGDAQERDFPNATTESAGVMSALDKAALDNAVADIETLKGTDTTHGERIAQAENRINELASELYAKVLELERKLEELINNGGGGEDVEELIKAYVDGFNATLEGKGVTLDGENLILEGVTVDGDNLIIT